MKIYLDNCALGRLTDDENQPRIRVEAKAMRVIIRLVGLGQMQWFSSTALEAEMLKTKMRFAGAARRSCSSGATSLLQSNPMIASRSVTLQAAGLTHFDAQHLAFAEAAAVDAFLTTDRLIRKARRLLRAISGSGTRTLTVENPVDWLRGNIR